MEKYWGLFNPQNTLAHSIFMLDLDDKINTQKHWTINPSSHKSLVISATNSIPAVRTRWTCIHNIWLLFIIKHWLKRSFSRFSSKVWLQCLVWHISQNEIMLRLLSPTLLTCLWRLCRPISKHSSPIYCNILHSCIWKIVKTLPIEPLIQKKNKRTRQHKTSWHRESGVTSSQALVCL